MQSKEMFKLAFVRRCFDEGVNTEAAILDRIQVETKSLEKRAGLADGLNSLYSKYNAMPDAQKGQLQKAVLLGAATLPLAAGATAGMIGSKLKGNYLDDSDVKNQELVDELHRQSQLARQHRRLSGGLPPTSSI